MLFHAHNASFIEKKTRTTQTATRQLRFMLPIKVRNGCKFFPHASLSRLVLSAASDYFAAMFTNDVREAKQEEIKMEGVDPDALKALVHYAYTGNLLTG